ncbi:DUF4097 family beta strand repeat-containing protein [uncultured Paenibacillus sp.]|uniref:DUF4097 family beta strand repeat-containing protein n=1 Tax=uncultured Paenibacillus sp. TaxID=227322 RepID=UPI0015B2D4F7|nr:DUF4097 family beta strand repeat-containing protein [uncultured Paenibacillus sp.]
MKKIVYFAVALLIIGVIGTAVTIPKTNTFAAIGLFPDRTETGFGSGERGKAAERQEPPQDLDGVIRDFHDGMREGTTDMVDGIMEEVAGVVDEAVSAGLSGLDDLELPEDNFSDDPETRDVSRSESMDGKGIREIVIQTAAADVKLAISDSSAIGAELKGKASSDFKDDELITKQGDTLFVATERSRKNVDNLRSDLKLTVYLPFRSFDRLSVTTASGDVEAFGLQAKQSIEVQTASGDITLNQAKAARVALDSSSGSIEASDLQGGLEVKSVSGDLKLDLRNDPLDGNLTAQTTSGDIGIALKKSQAFALRFDTVAGEGQVDVSGMEFGKRTDQEIEGQIGDAKFTVKASTTSGDFALE